MLNDIKTPPPDPSDDSVAGRRRDGRAGSISGAIIPGATGPSPSIRPNEVTRAVDPTAPDSGHVPRNPLVQPHAHVGPHTERAEPGLHKARVMGEPTHIDPEYAMPMEDRGSFFSLMLSAVVVAVVAILLFAVWWSFFRTAASVTPVTP